MKKSENYEVLGETLVLYLPEELDHCSVDVIRKETEQFFLERRIRNVVFSYANTHFMDSSGIGLVMGRYREVRYLNGNIYIVCVNPKVSRILDISGLYRVAKKADTVEAALAVIDKQQDKTNCG